MTTFTVAGPFDIPCYKAKVSRRIEGENIRRFWQDHGEYADARGCYVFGIRTGKGVTPWYVGKAEKGFRQEVFSDHKLRHYQAVLADCPTGIPVLFFVVLTPEKGKVKVTAIRELERLLIRAGVVANPALRNKKGTRLELWEVAGVLHSSPGKPTKAARVFRRMMRL